MAMDVCHRETSGLRPRESRDIAIAEAWLVKRKWKQWGS